MDKNSNKRGTKGGTQGGRGKASKVPGKVAGGSKKAKSGDMKEVNYQALCSIYEALIDRKNELIKISRLHIENLDDVLNLKNKLNSDLSKRYSELVIEKWSVELDLDEANWDKKFLLFSNAVAVLVIIFMSL